MEPKTILMPEARLMQEQSAEGCCAPECGPDTCGGAYTPVSVNMSVKAGMHLNPDARSVQATSGGCYHPDGGLETCATEQSVGGEATWMQRSDKVEGDTADARACSCSATGPLSARQKITVVLFFLASATVIVTRIYGLI